MTAWNDYCWSIEAIVVVGGVELNFVEAIVCLLLMSRKHVPIGLAVPLAKDNLEPARKEPTS